MDDGAGELIFGQLRVEAPDGHSQPAGLLPGLKQRAPEQDEFNSLDTKSKVEVLRAPNPEGRRGESGDGGCRLPPCGMLPGHGRRLAVLPLPPGQRGSLGAGRSRRSWGFLCESARKGSMECARSWVTTGHDRSRICIFRGLPIPTGVTRVRAHTHAVQNRSLVQTHWGLRTQQEKEKQERICLLWFFLRSLIP